MRPIYKIIPFEKLNLETSLSKEEVLKRLSTNIQPGSPKWNWFTGKSSSNAYFGGALDETGFQVSRNISYRNSFLPEIEGKIEALRFGCTVDLSLKPSMFIMIIGVIGLLAILISSISALSVYFSTMPDGRELGMLRPLALFGIACSIFLGGFKYESVKARKFLKKLLDAEEVHG